MPSIFYKKKSKFVGKYFLFICFLPAERRFGTIFIDKHRILPLQEEK